MGLNEICLLHILKKLKRFNYLQIVHRDLAARNIVVSGEDGEYVLKITDFGLAREICDGMCTLYHDSLSYLCTCVFFCARVFFSGRQMLSASPWF